MQPRRNICPFVWRAALLTVTFASGIIWFIVSDPPWRAFGVYASVLSLFHLSEFLTIALIKPRSLKPDSFLLNHSPEYHMAAVASWTEFVIESYLFPGFKSCIWLTMFGLVICLIGEFIRKLSMFTAGSNFSHTVEYRKERGHMLVTRGIYSLWRHPSYAGWFYWSMGTQIILLNPVCLIGYIVASYKFFKQRILDEELILIEFFGNDYIAYKKQVLSTGIPFLRIM